MFSRITQSPTLVRVVPFAIFIVFTVLQDRFGEVARYWIYFGKTLAGAAMLAVVWRHIEELRWRLSWPAVLVGIGVFIMWVGLDAALIKAGLPNSYPKPKTSAFGWNPNATFGDGTGLALFFMVVRIVGSSLVVPPLEEIFFRSFVYRYFISHDFARVPLNRFHPFSFLATSVLFGIEHREWLAGILCGLAYQSLVIRKNRLGDAITAHTITNCLLGLWVVWRGAWQFW